jgi:DNA-binding SARP family transcriptional activator
MLEATAFGPFELRRGGERVPIKLLWARKLIALLLLRPNHQWTRDAICGYLWPDAELEVARNRLRTTLVEVRAALEPEANLEADRHHVQLITNALENPLQHAKLLTRRVQIAADPTGELGALDRLLDLIDHDLYDGWEDEWIIAERLIWEHRRAEGRLRRAQLRIESGNLDGAIQDAGILLERSRYDEPAWRIFVRAMEQQSNSEIALDQLRVAQRELKETGLSFSEELLDFARLVRSRAGSSHAIVTEDMSIFLGKVFQRLLDFDPEKALAWLGSDAARMEVFIDPHMSQPVYDLVLGRTEGTSEARVQALLNYLQGQSLQHKSEELFKLAPAIAESDAPVPMRRSAANLLSFAHFQVREYHKADEYGQLVLQLSYEARDEVWIVSAEGQLASFAWHQGRYAEAIESYISCNERFAKIGTPLAELNSCIVSTNLSIVLTITEQYELAEAWSDRESAARRKLNYHAIDAMADPVRGFLKMNRGKPEEGVELIIRGMGSGLRTKDLRSLEIGLDYLAGALGMRGHGAQGMAVAQRATEFRAPRRHVRSVAEERQYATVRRLCGDALPDPGWLRIDRVSELIALATDLIS